MGGAHGATDRNRLLRADSGCKLCRLREVLQGAVNERTFVFEAIDEDVEVVFKTGCGDCPGLVLPKLDLQKVVLESLGTGFDAVYFGTCVKKAIGIMSCPMNLEGISAVIEDKFGVPVIVGTHDD